MINVQSVKNKARDVLIKETMGNPLATLSIDYYVDHTNYGGFCNDDEVDAVLGQIYSQDTQCNINPNGNPSTIQIFKLCCHHNANIWVACAQLYSTSDKAWCADSTGARKEIDISVCRNSMTSCN
ncbi:MAG: hypothetical protein Q7R95_06240 [bacterium]|nr:hypothetical protein [bacterium]